MLGSSTSNDYIFAKKIDWNYREMKKDLHMICVDIKIEY